MAELGTTVYKDGKLGTNIRHDRDTKRGVYDYLTYVTSRFIPYIPAPYLLGQETLLFEQKTIDFTPNEVEKWGTVTTKSFSEEARNLTTTMYRFGLSKSMTSHEEQRARAMNGLTLDDFRSNVMPAHMKQLAHSTVKGIIKFVETLAGDTVADEFNVVKEANLAKGRDACFVQKLPTTTTKYELADELMETVRLLRLKNMEYKNPGGQIKCLMGPEFNRRLIQRGANEPTQKRIVQEECGPNLNMYILDDLGDRCFLYHPDRSILGVYVAELGHRYPDTSADFGAVSISSTSSFTDFFCTSMGATSVIHVKD